MNLSLAAWIAIAAACAAAAALALFAYLLVQVRHLRAGQEVLLGGGKATSSTLPSRSRDGSTTCTERSTRSLPA